MEEKQTKPYYQLVDGFCVPGTISPDALRSAFNYKPKEGDFFVVTFPKCGTTWVQQIVSLIFDKGQTVSSRADFFKRSPFLELFGADAVDIMKRPGAIKLHLPFHLAPYSTKAKYLYVVRNPKDTVVSFFHHSRHTWYKFENGLFEDFFEVFMKGENDFGDYFDHVLSWYNHRNDGNILFITYEELKLDTPNTVKKIAKFMGEEYLEMLENDVTVFDNVLKYSTIEHMRFLNRSDSDVEDDVDKNLENMPPGLKHVLDQVSQMKHNPGETFELVREGKVGGWRTELSDEQNLFLNNKMESKFKGTDFLAFWKTINSI